MISLKTYRDLHRIKRSGQPLLVTLIVLLVVVSKTAGAKSQWLTFATSNLTTDFDGQLTFVG